MKVSVPRVSENGGMLRIASVMRNGGGTEKEVWFELTGALKRFVATESCDAFLVCALIPAIVQGENIEVDGPVSEKLLHNINSQLVPILCAYLATDKFISVTSKTLNSESSTARGVLSGFSGGVDSFCMFHDHSGERASSGYRVTHFSYNNVGSHGQNEKDEKVFQGRLKHIRTFAESEGIPVIAVNSNVDDFIGMKFQKTHTLRNVAVALLLQNGFRRFLYSSTFQYGETKIAPSYDMAYLDSVILPLLGTEKLDCVLTGAQHSRVNKTALVSRIEASRRYLDVCVHIAPVGMLNCGLCWKCMRTELTFDALGVLAGYSTVFPLDEFKRFRKLYLVEVLTSKDPLVKEIRSLIKQTNYSVPWGVRVAALIVPSFVGKKISRAFPRLRKRKALLGLMNALL